MSRKATLFLLLFITLLLTIQISAQNNNNANTILQAVDSAPLAGEELDLDGTFQVYFDRVLDCATVANAVSITPEINGLALCTNPNTITYELSDGVQFARDTEYTLTIDTTLRGADGSQLLDPIVISRRTGGTFKVTQAFPAPEAIGIDTTSPITVIFNRPIVPLVLSTDMTNLPNPLTLVPNIAGTGEWVNTSIYTFTPDEPLIGGTVYSAIVDPSLIATDGAVMQDDGYSWTFTTETPYITEFTPRNIENSYTLDTPIRVTFNQPMDTVSVEDAFRLTNTNMDVDVVGTFEWNEDETTMRFTPDFGLAIDSFYSFQILETARGKNSTATLDFFDAGFSTIPFPRIIETFPNDGTPNASPYSGFEIFFASPMDIESLEDKFIITPEPERINTYYSSWSDSYSVNFQPQPATTYTVQVLPGMSDIYGNVINENYTFSYTTGNFSSDLIARTVDDVGLYNAYNETTQLFIQYRNVTNMDLALYNIPNDVLMNRFIDRPYNPVSNFTPQPETLMRSWQIPSEAAPNIMRFELLDLGSLPSGTGGTENVVCRGSLPSRVNIGDLVVVTSEPDPLRARSEPPAGEIVELLYRDYALTIVDGPICTDDSLLWWNVELRDNSTAWVAESVAGEYMIEVRDPAETAVINVEDVAGGSLEPGAYYLSVSAPEIRTRGYGEIDHMLIVANANITVKATIDSVWVWVTDLQSGLPIANAPLVMIDETGARYTATTDAQGLAVIETPRIDNLYDNRLVMLDDGIHYGIGITSWTDGLNPWSFGQEDDFYPSTHRIYTYTDRPIYRPGQPVYFKGIVRAKDDMTYSVPQGTSAFVTIRDDQGDTVFENFYEINQFGSISGQFNIDVDAPLGNYSLTVSITDPAFPNQNPRGGISFSVAEYRLPEFLVEMEAITPEVVQGDMAEVSVDATYFFGGSVSNANVTYNVISEPYSFRYTGDGFYSWQDFNYDAGASFYFDSSTETIASGDVMTDASGQVIIQVPADLQDDTQSQSFTIEAVVTDETNQAVAGRSSVVVHKGLVYAGIRPISYIASVNNEATFDVITVDWDSEPVENQDITIEILERRWFSVQEQDERGRTSWTWDVEEIPITDSTLTSDTNGQAQFTFVPTSGGVYKARVTTRDERGNEIVSSSTIWVSGREYVNWRQQNSNRIDLIADKDEYQVGEVAEILIASPFQGQASALVTVERGDVLKTELITMDTNSTVYRLPIDESYTPNVFVSVLIIKGVDETNPVAGFRMGLIQLGVDTSQREMNINITSNTDRAQPQDVVTYTVQTTDYAGNPIPAEVGVGVTDLASLSIADSNSRPILPFFYSEQALGVRTALGLTVNTDQITQEILDTIKGGGGGFGEDGLVEIRGEFVDTPYWNGSIITDSNGTAQFDVRLPDNLTTWRLDARAIGNDANNNLIVGQDTFDLLSTKPLIIRPVTPRFFVVDDRVILGAVVNNNTTETQEVLVTLNATGIETDSPLQQTITIDADSRERVEWDVRIQDVPQAVMSFTAQAGEFSDGSISPVSLDEIGSLPVYKFEVPETVGTAGVLRTSDTRVESIVLPQRFNITQGTLTVKVEQSLAGATVQGLSYLQNYPHQCVEQTVSRFLPNIMTVRALNDLNLANDRLQDNLDEAIGFALQKLYAEQKPDGGWGWFVQEESNTLTTAYAIIGLYEAKEMGYSISNSALLNAQEFLLRNLRTLDNSSSQWELNRQAFVLYALARTKFPDIARSANLFELRGNMSLYAQAMLAETFYYIDPSDSSRAGVLISDLVSKAIVSATGIHWDEDQRDYRNWNTNTRTTALIMSALIKWQPESDLIPNVVRYLMVQRQADAWETTQETAWAVMALTDWMRVSQELNPDYAYQVSLNNTILGSGVASPNTVFDIETLQVDVTEMIQGQANQLVFERIGTDMGSLYYTAHLEAYLPVPAVEPLDRGIIINRTYTMLGDETRTPITSANVGDIIQVRLSIVVPNSLHYVVIDDPLPAGAEAVNPELSTSQTIGTEAGLDLGSPLSRGWGWWYFSNIEFRDERVVMYSSFLPAGAYEYVYTMRASVEGEYNVIPTTGQEFYFPEVYGRGAGTLFTITDE